MTKIHTIMGIVAMAALAALAAPAQAQPLRLDIGNLAIGGTMPPGFCLPTGNDKRTADLLAKGDPDNETLAMLIPCAKANQPGGITYDYYLIKAPRGMPTDLKRGEFIAAMAMELSLPVYHDGSASAKVLDSSGGTVSDALGTKVDLTGEIRPRGTDDVCVYLGGELNVNSALKSYPIAVGGCGTIVGGRLIFVYAYDDPKKSGAVAEMLRRSRKLAAGLAASGDRAN